MASRECYLARAEDGIYDSIATQLQNMGHASLALAELDEHFSCRTTTRGNISYVSKDGSEFNANIIGEIRPSYEGTVHSAAGNHYSGPAANVSPLPLFFSIFTHYTCSR